MVISSPSADPNADWAGVEWLMQNGLTLAQDITVRDAGPWIQDRI